MDRYINATEFCKRLTPLLNKQVENSRNTTKEQKVAFIGALAEVACILRHMPEEKVAPVVYGDWITVTDDDDDWGVMEYNKCSICGFTTYGTDNYCPNCGATMRKDDGNQKD